MSNEIFNLNGEAAPANDNAGIVLAAFNSSSTFGPDNGYARGLLQPSVDNDSKLIPQILHVGKSLIYKFDGDGSSEGQVPLVSPASKSHIYDSARSIGFVVVDSTDMHVVCCVAKYVNARFIEAAHLNGLHYALSRMLESVDGIKTAPKLIKTLVKPVVMVDPSSSNPVFVNMVVVV